MEKNFGSISNLIVMSCILKCILHVCMCCRRITYNMENHLENSAEKKNDLAINEGKNDEATHIWFSLAKRISKLKIDQNANNNYHKNMIKKSTFVFNVQWNRKTNHFFIVTKWFFSSISMRWFTRDYLHPMRLHTSTKLLCFLRARRL